MDERKKILAKVHRVVIKIGSTILTKGESGLNTTRIGELVDEVVSVLEEKKIEIAIVSSGAVAAGMGRVGLQTRPREIPVKQAAAAVG